MTTINIHEWPATPTLDYQIAVMQAAAKGALVEIWEAHSWVVVDYPGWNWLGRRYRIKRSVPVGLWIGGSKYAQPGLPEKTCSFMALIASFVWVIMAGPITGDGWRLFKGRVTSTNWRSPFSN